MTILYADHYCKADDTWSFTRELVAAEIEKAYQRGRASMKALLTSQSSAFDSGYNAGRDAMREECQQECSAEADEYGVAQRISLAIGELK